MHSRHSVPALLALITTISSNAFGQSCTAISSLPFPITQPGKYCLAANLTASGAGIQIGISASQVELDLAGFSLNCSASQNGIFTTTSSSTTLRFLTIRNGQISGCNFAVSLSRCDQCVVENLRLRDNAVGVHVSGHAAQVRANSVHQTQSNQGNPAFLVDAYNAVVEANLVSNAATGLIIQGKGNSVRGNSFGNCGTAIRFDTPAIYQDNHTQGCSLNFTGNALGASKDAGGNF